ncbi:TIR domain-containing protein [Desulfovibrio falkowii]
MGFGEQGGGMVGLFNLWDQKTPSYRKIFPSYDWDDVWFVNQIINLPVILGRENVGFVKNVPNEEVKKSDAAVKAWIDQHMSGCSCLVLFCGERTYQSRWVKYELEKAHREGMARLIIHLNGMKSRFGFPCQKGIDPYVYHGMYGPIGSGYVIKQYEWISGNGVQNIGLWINDACLRAGK